MAHTTTFQQRAGVETMIPLVNPFLISMYFYFKRSGKLN